MLKYTYEGEGTLLLRLVIHMFRIASFFSVAFQPLETTLQHKTCEFSTSRKLCHCSLSHINFLCNFFFVLLEALYQCPRKISVYKGIREPFLLMDIFSGTTWRLWEDFAFYHTITNQMKKIKPSTTLVIRAQSQLEQPARDSAWPRPVQWPSTQYYGTA